MVQARPVAVVVRLGDRPPTRELGAEESVDLASDAHQPPPR
jgi:hypothetical protein